MEPSYQALVNITQLSYSYESEMGITSQSTTTEVYHMFLGNQPILIKTSPVKVCRIGVSFEVKMQLYNYSFAPVEAVLYDLIPDYIETYIYSLKVNDQPYYQGKLQQGIYLGVVPSNTIVDMVYRIKVLEVPKNCLFKSRAYVLFRPMLDQSKQTLWQEIKSNILEIGIS